MKLNLSFVSRDKWIDSNASPVYNVTCYGDKSALDFLSYILADADIVLKYLRFSEDKKTDGDGELMPQPKLSADIPF